jgi:hypothetical protein
MGKRLFPQGSNNWPNPLNTWPRKPRCVASSGLAWTGREFLFFFKIWPFFLRAEAILVLSHNVEVWREKGMYANIVQCERLVGICPPSFWHVSAHLECIFNKILFTRYVVKLAANMAEACIKPRLTFHKSLAGSPARQRWFFACMYRARSVERCLRKVCVYSSLLALKHSTHPWVM